MAETLENNVAEHQERTRRERELVRDIKYSAQASVFSAYPNRKEFDIYATMKIAKEAGGDFYDFYLLDQDRLGFLIADVAGKGIPAVMFMMHAKTLIQGLAQSGLDVHRVFDQMNR